MKDMMMKMKEMIKMITEANVTGRQAAYGSFLERFKTAGQNLLAAFDPNEQNRTSTTDGNYLDKSPKHNYNKKQHICII